MNNPIQTPNEYSLIDRAPGPLHSAEQDQKPTFDTNPGGRLVGGRFVPIATPEQRAAGLARAKQLRKERALTLRSDFMDDSTWTELAQAAGIKLPPYGVPCTAGRMSRWLSKLGIPTEAYLLWNGADLTGRRQTGKLSDFIVRNPAWPLKAWVGLMLEHRDLILRQWGAAA